MTMEKEVEIYIKLNTLEEFEVTFLEFFNTFDPNK